jgi:L-rhamnose mutarotase
MPKIILELNYSIYPEKRDEYLEIAKKMTEIIQSSAKNYSIYENKKGSNHFSEIYLCESEAEFEAIDDNENDEVTALTDQLFQSFIVDKKVTYSTKYEL